uniref:Uncharacterized protein n=1 Tax=Manihot esculenta TaxID=3983 RepID=A0A2C9U161_MANES
MKQRSSPHYQPKYTSNDEIEVAEVLLKLHTLIAESEYGLQLPLSWGSKRRRSADDSHRRVLLPSTPFPSLHGIGGLLVSVFDPDKTKTAVKVEASSPATPLSFSPSESDEKPKRLKRKASAKKTKEQLLEIVEQYTQSNESLTKEIEKSRQKYEELKASNLWLQAKKQELNLGIIRREEPQLEPKTSKNSLNYEVKIGQALVKASSTVVGYKDNHQLRLVIDQRPLIIDRTANKTGIGESYQYAFGQTLSLFPSRTGLGMSSISEDVGPSGIPDLNVSLVDSLWMDFAHPVDENRTLTKALAAQARHRRMQICREKNSYSKLRLSHR